MTAAGLRPVRCAIAGAGWAGTRLAQAAQELGGSLHVSSLVDPDEVQLASVARQLGIGRTHVSLEDALEDDIDAVLICSPHRDHAPQALIAIASGRHVLVEKPMALDLSDADAMVRTAAAAGVVLGVAENEVYEPWVDELRRMVASRQPLGDLAFAVVTAGHRSPDGRYPGRRAWLTQPTAGGTGSWLLHGIHTVAVCRRIFGEFSTVYAREHRTPSYERSDLEATMSLMLTDHAGAPVHLVQTPEVDLGAERRAISLYGDRGVLHADRVGWTLQRAGIRPPAPESGPFPAGTLSSYAAELDAFARAVRGGPPMVTTGRSERNSLSVVLGALESARSGTAVDLGITMPE